MSKDKTRNLRLSVRSTLPANVSASCPLPSSAASSLNVHSDVLGDGISGNAMALPPPKPATFAVRPDNTARTTNKGRPRNLLLVSKSDTSNCKTKQVKEVTDDRSQELIHVLVHLSCSVSQCFDLFIYYKNRTRSTKKKKKTKTKLLYTTGYVLLVMPHFAESQFAENSCHLLIFLQRKCR